MSTESTLSSNEVELYRLLERANLLQYFTNFLAKGGDDLSQLSEASKDEFDEIIELVGMRQKPLHIRRLQKALRDWTSNTNILTESTTEIEVPESSLVFLKVNQVNIEPSPSMMLIRQQNTRNKLLNNEESNIFMNQSMLPINDNDNMASSTNNNNNNSSSTNNNNNNNNSNLSGFPPLFGTQSIFPTTAMFNSNNRQSVNGNLRPMDLLNSSGLLPSPVPSTGGIPVSMLPNAVLSNAEKHRIKLAASNLAHTLPHIDARINSTGRKDVNKGVMNVLSMSKEDPLRENEIYKYSAIYGRFNAPRRTGKPMNHHEVSVNEAAAQLCIQIPQLITRRDNLFHLARQVVKMAEELPPSNLSDPFSHLLPTKLEPTVVSNENYEEFENQISTVKREIEGLLEQECRIRESYREAKQSNQALLMNELQKRLDEILNQLNNKFTEQTSLATKRMMVLGCSRPNYLDNTIVNGNTTNNVSHDITNYTDGNILFPQMKFESNNNSNNTFLSNNSQDEESSPVVMDQRGSNNNNITTNSNSGLSFNSSEEGSNNEYEFKSTDFGDQ